MWEDTKAINLDVPDKDDQLSKKYPQMPRVIRAENHLDLLRADPKLHAAWEDVCAALRNEMLPMDAVAQLVESMPASVQRELVYKMSGMEDSIMTTIKQQIRLIDAVLKRVINTDGTSVRDSGIDITPKEAMTMSMKLTQSMSQHLPKLIKVDNIQRWERALMEVAEQHLTKQQQSELIGALSRIKLEDAN